MRIRSHPQSDTGTSIAKRGAPAARLYVYLFIAIMLGALLWAKAGQSEPKPQLIEWQTDHDAAMQTAAESGRPTFVLFTASWCPPCQQMKRSVWTDRAVADVLNKTFTPIKVDCSDSNETASVALQQKYGIRGVPTLIVHDIEGRELGRTNGLTSKQLLTWLDSLNVKSSTDAPTNGSAE